MEYPKINTIWKRDEKHIILEGELSCPEFDAIKLWNVTEKVDGTNIRVLYHKDREIIFAGKTNNAEIPSFLMEYLKKEFTQEKMLAAFPDAPVNKVILFGEEYGGKIQSGGKYRPDCSFILFDVWIDGWWLERKNVKDIAAKLGIDIVPDLGLMPMEEAINLVKNSAKSIIAQKDLVAEGIVARSSPLMLFRKGDPIMWKLKVRDYGRLNSQKSSILQDT
jgi:ATP-dependent RNA circularization protein (DNA/RNA ligase family)